MKKFILFYVCVFFFTALGYAQNHTTPDALAIGPVVDRNGADPIGDRSCDAGDLKARARKDLAFVKQTLLENHPGTYNSDDPDFVKLVNDGYTSAVTQVEGIKSEDDYIAVMQTYAALFDDGHLWIRSMNEKRAREQQPQRAFTISEGPMADGVWMTIPTFKIDAEQQKLFDDLIQKLPSYRTKKVIVFDLRGNTGGSSAWGHRLVTALFTKAYADEKLLTLDKDLSVDWRISKGNIENTQDIVKMMKESYGEGSKEYQDMQKIYLGMLAAQVKGQPYYHEAPVQSAPSNKSIQDPVKAEIVLVIDHRCGSACLDFIDLIKAMQHKTLLVGETTAADTLYMEVRPLQLPSGLAEIWFPTKVYRHRKRGSREPYVPDIKYPGNLQDTDSLKKWLQKTIAHEIDVGI